MYTPYPEYMMESIKKVEATRKERMSTEPRRLTADEKDALLKEFHPDYKEEAFEEIKVGPNKGQKANKELVHLLHSNSIACHRVGVMAVNAMEFDGLPVEFQNAAFHTDLPYAHLFGDILAAG